MITLKFGGSMTKAKHDMLNLIKDLEALSKDNDFIIVPGGGEFADCVRRLDNRLGLSDDVAHRLAILAMDQMGYLLSSFSKRFFPIKSLNEIESCLNNAKIPVLIPSHIMLDNDELEASWDVTSDSISTYVAHLTGSERLLLLKDVDGLFDSDPVKNKNVRLIESVNASELKNLKLAGVDEKLADYILKFKIPAYFVNGHHPERIGNIINSEKTLCTKITPD